MSLSFEEMADSGLPDVEESSPAVGRFKVFVLIGLACVAATGLGVFFHSSAPELPEAAVILLSAEGEVPSVLPHSLDSATEFEESFDYLKEGEAEPEYRVPDEVRMLTETMTAGVADPEVRIRQDAVVESTRVAQVEKAPAAVLDRSSEIVIQAKLSADAEVVFSRDWGGVVLVPDFAKLAKAYTSDVRLARVEAHPIDNEQLRVWARIQNLTDVPMTAEVGCEFRSSQYSHVDSARFEPLAILAGDFVDVQFVSPHDRVESYTVMVKRER